MFRNQIKEGMLVRSTDGDKLGKVTALGPDTFTIEKGLLFKEDHQASYDRVADIRDNEIIYRRLEAGETAARGSAAGSLTEEQRIPLAEEELVAEKQRRQAGSVEVRKEVITEQRQVTVPVTREEVVVERVPASRTTPKDVRFQDEKVVVPVMEEEVELAKRPVVREEVRVRKTPHEEQRTASAEIRREEAHIEERGTRHGTGWRDDDPSKKL